MISLLSAAENGVGVYSIPEAARYAKIHQNTLRNWFSGGTDRAPLRGVEIESEDFKVITFLDFVEAVAIRSLRVDYGVSFQKIREAVKIAKERYGITHPFAHQKHKTVLVGKELHVFLPEDQTNPVQLTGRFSGQKSFKPCIERYMDDLVFDESGIAQLYKAFRFNGQEIILNPRVHFGDPIVKENGYTAETLYRAAVTEGSVERAAHLYDASIASVDAAYRYWNNELGKAA
jgi:uncharacterized protein (DUF433 family)